MGDTECEENVYRAGGGRVPSSLYIRVRVSASDAKFGLRGATKNAFLSTSIYLDANKRVHVYIYVYIAYVIVNLW